MHLITPPAGADRRRIDTTDEADVRYWTEKLGVSADCIRQAVDQVGVSPDAVFHYVRRVLGG